MSASPRVVQADIQFTWDGVPTRLQRGQVIDVAPGSPLEQAIGADLLTPLRGRPAPQQPAQVPGEDEPQAAQRKTRSKTQDTGTATGGDKDGDA